MQEQENQKYISGRTQVLLQETERRKASKAQGGVGVFYLVLGLEDAPKLLTL